jgi:RNA polymerase sigma factor (sigma-70 family)
MTGRVLVVDDEKAIVSRLVCLLEADEIEGFGAFDRLSAEALMEKTFYAVIVADLHLHTEAEGLELLDGIRRISPQSLVLTLTGFSTPELDAEVRRRGSVRVIRKPAGGAEIIAAVSDLLAAVERLAADEEALDLEKLHVGLSRLLHSIPQKRYGLTVDESEEVVQQAWLLFLQKRDVIRMARPWLIGTVANLSKRQIALSRRRRETFVGGGPLDFPDVRAERAETEIALGQALNVLDPQSRALCVLIAVEGYAYDEVSALLNLPLGSIGPMYIRAKSKMRLTTAA